MFKNKFQDFQPDSPTRSCKEKFSSKLPMFLSYLDFTATSLVNDWCHLIYVGNASWFITFNLKTQFSSFHVFIGFVSSAFFDFVFRFISSIVCWCFVWAWICILLGNGISSCFVILLCFKLSLRFSGRIIFFVFFLIKIKIGK